MNNIKWNAFYQDAYPDYMVTEELKKSIIWRINRWIGIRCAYVFYRLGFSANQISIIRLVMASIGFFLLSYAVSTDIWEPIIGLVLIIWQVNLDFADGVIARVQNKSSDFGEQMDGLANAASRAAMVILFGYFTQNAFLFWLSVFSGYVLSAFWDSTKDHVFKQRRLENFRKLFRLSSSVFFTVILLPLIVVLLGIFDIWLEEISYIITVFYIFLSILWLSICCFKGE